MNIENIGKAQEKAQAAMTAWHGISIFLTGAGNHFESVALEDMSVEMKQAKLAEFNELRDAAYAASQAFKDIEEAEDPIE